MHLAYIVRASLIKSKNKHTKPTKIAKPTADHTQTVDIQLQPRRANHIMTTGHLYDSHHGLIMDYSWPPSLCILHIVANVKCGISMLFFIVASFPCLMSVHIIFRLIKKFIHDTI